MDWRRLLLGSLTLVVLGNSADAGVIFNRSKSKEQPKEAAKPTAPEDRVGDLVKVLRASPDERKRIAAADELAKSDLRQTPQAGEALIAALQQDPSAAVRAESAQAISKLRPLTLQAGQALEDAQNSDTSPRVRTAARTAMGVYIQAGYRTGGPAESRPAAPNAPAAQRPTQVAKKPMTQPQPPAQPQRPAGRQTGEPPLAKSKPIEESDSPRPILLPRQDKAPAIELKPEPKPAPTAPRFLGPVNESKPEAPKPAKPTKPDDDGPILIGPG